MEEGRAHNVTVTSREKITITAVEDIESFDEEKVVVMTSLGIMEIRGRDFKMHRLDVEDGQLIIEGVVDEIAYADVQEKPHGGFFSRIFQ